MPAIPPVKVRFSNVGRQKMSWTAPIQRLYANSSVPLFDAMLREIKRKGALISHDIEINREGNIFAGFRIVGHWEVVKEPAMSGEATEG
jgi:hypothetical protein